MSDFDIVMVTNRTSQPFESMFDGKVVSLKPNETKPMAANVARNVVAQSYHRIEMTTGVPRDFRLGIVNETDCSPLDRLDERAEVLDRSSSEGLRHHRPQILTQRGLEAIPSATIGASPVVTPVSSALLREKASASTTRSHKKKKVLTAKAMEFDNPPPQHSAAFGSGSAIALDR